MKLIKPATITFIALAYACIFGVVWAVVGGRAGFLVLGITSSFFSSVTASTLVTSLIATSPLAFVAGRVGGKQFLVYTTLSFVLAWVALNIVYVRVPLLANKAVLTPLVAEMVAITCLSYAFSALGNRTNSASA